MISVLPVGMVFPPGPTGVTRLIVTGTLVAPCGEAIRTVPVLAPGGRPDGFAVTVRLVPSVGRVPEGGETVRKDLSVLATNDVDSARPGTKILVDAGCDDPSGTVTSPCPVVPVTGSA